MRIIQSQKFKNLQADLIDHPPVSQEDDRHLIKDKKKKKIYQLNYFVDDIDIEDVVE
jgi:hypothetical protein